MTATDQFSTSGPGAKRGNAVGQTVSRSGTRAATAAQFDAVTLSVFSSVLAGTAEEMGAMLVRASCSSNIKERRDCSCAIFDAAGHMVAQAEHIPVHLGAMQESVQAVMKCSPEAGDVFLLNDPYSGGTHLPDITAVTPVGHRGEIVAYTVSRAHHSDVGGMTPGSMPANSTMILQEGLVIPPLRLLRRGVLAEDLLRFLLANVRTPALRRADLLAQVAANALGSRRLTDLIGRHGLSFVQQGFQELMDYGERQVRDALRVLPDGTYTATGELEGDGTHDDDIPIHVQVTIEHDKISFDFSGTAGPVKGNVNCPRSVTRSACLFALRVALPAQPTIAGAAAALDILMSAPCLLDARWPAAIVAGNVETSQRVADILLEALGRVAPVPAGGQGTMNNLIIGGSDWTYYETIGGGQGASEQGEGASAVHVGMSNALNTPIEALETELPLRVQRYQVRYGSGGEGRHRGGDGIERSVQVLEAATLSVIADRRRHQPTGRAGGGDGACGQNLLDGEPMPPKFTCELAPGQTITILTPGGGGFGPPDT